MRLSLLLLATHGYAAHWHLSGRHPSTSDLHQRTSVAGSATHLGDSQNMVYLTNASLNGKPFSIMIDTGSSDLWVSPAVPGAVPQNYQAAVTYASGSASGEVMSATFDFAGYSIESQFFIQAPDGNAAPGADGLIGLGPGSSSNVRALGSSAAADPPLDRIFASNNSITSLIAVLLQRSDDPDDPYPGDLAIGEVLSDYQAILSQPRLSVTTASLQGGQHWQTLLDVDGIIAPDGKPIQIQTQLAGARTPNATVMFDTGFTLPQVPPYVAQALYGKIPGAALNNVPSIGNIWVLPCNQQVSATFLFGGIRFPIHPLDLNFDGFDLKENGEPVCVGAFQPYASNVLEDIGVDMILGMAFLRNAYLLVNFGNMLNMTSPSANTAYIQLLSITNATEAAEDFARVRGNTGSAANLASTNIKPKYKKKSSGASWLLGLIIGVVIVVALLAVAGVYFCRRRRRLAPSTAWKASTRSYQPIHGSSPQAAYDMHMDSSGAPADVPEYKTAWDMRH